VPRALINKLSILLETSLCLQELLNNMFHVKDVGCDLLPEDEDTYCPPVKFVHKSRSTSIDHHRPGMYKSI
jgi:hypothetical protein